MYPTNRSGAAIAERLNDGETLEVNAAHGPSFFVQPTQAGIPVANSALTVLASTTSESVCRFTGADVERIEDLPQQKVISARRVVTMMRYGFGPCSLTFTHQLPDGTTGATTTVEFVLVDES